jgi:heme-degrading monooxygenase HmoA
MYFNRDSDEPRFRLVTVLPGNIDTTRWECGMIGTLVTFRCGDNFDEQTVRKIAETARVRFEGMPGLRSKAFTVNSGKHEALNFYVWDSEDAAKAFFTDALLERVTDLYGVHPSVEFVQIATLVENARA